MNQYIDNIIDAIGRVASDSDQMKRISTLSAELGWSSDEEIDFLLSEIARVKQQLPAGDLPGIETNPAAVDTALEVVLGRIIHEQRQRQSPAMSPQRISLIENIYELSGGSSRVRSYLLGWLAGTGLRDALVSFTELMINDPPQSSTDIVVAFAPLLNEQNRFPVDAVFPNLLQAVQHLSVAAAVLDLANFVTRAERVDCHPAADRRASLVAILDRIVERLAQIESGDLPSNHGPQQISQLVGESVSLVTSLCDALSLIGDVSAAESLRRASQLKHRQIRTESLSALCRLSQSDAQQPLIDMAAEPVVRLRALTYAEELNLLPRVPECHQSDEARAEGRLAMWLAHPTNMGLAPNSLQLVARKTLYWPSFDEPQDCFLFRYQYEFSHDSIENLGIVGPLTHAFASSLLHLELADVFACFAGWHCEHEEIKEYTLQQARTLQPGVVERLMSRLASWTTDDQTVLDAQPRFLGIFMGIPVLVASGRHRDRIGTYVVDEDQVSWFPAEVQELAAHDELAYCIYKGHKLLGAFNSKENWPGNNPAVSE